MTVSAYIISIHAPREGSDRGTAIRASANTLFLSTLPARGATRAVRTGELIHTISIHAPREGSDLSPAARPACCRDFYPRSPRGERLVDVPRQGRLVLFLSTLPARGATHDCSRDELNRTISIHAPREGSDHPRSSYPHRQRYFYPRSPRGERPPPACCTTSPRHFYPRSPRGERLKDRLHLHLDVLFLSTLPARGATPDFGPGAYLPLYFYPRSPRGERHRYRRADRLCRAFLSTLPARGATNSSCGSG